MESGKLENARVAIDLVIFTIRDKKLYVLLHEREKDPFQGKQELPGSLLHPGETAETTLARKLRDVVGETRAFFRQFATFTDPARDPRARTVSIGFVSLISEANIRGDFAWHDTKVKDLAFDHAKIVAAARAYLKEHVDASVLKQFMPERFPLNDLQDIYEVLEGTVYDNRNFRKKMIASAIVAETKFVEQNVSHRPAKLFRLV